MTDALDGRFGESWSGEVPNGSHINAVLARRGSPTAAAAAAALAGPRPGIVPFLACLSPGVVARPFTVVVNKSPIPDDPDARLGPITWGAAQLGIAQGVLDAVADGLIPAAEVPDVIVLVALWVDPRADDETSVRRANREAMRGAIADAVRPPTAQEVMALVERREEAANIYYTGS
jgi:5,6,7,8-tetrahydromethanopterin hydro-lyase